MRTCAVELGIVTPVLTMLPGAHAGWEREAPWSDVVEVVRAADRLGFHHITCSEHVAVPTAAAEERGGRYWDPLATFGYLAAVTERIRFATYVLVLGYHHPLEIAKRYGTLDVVTGGRLVLGVGVGSLREEFELLGARFEDRGARADEALRALRGSLGERQPRHEGEHYRYEDVVVEPHAIQAAMPIWVGGRSQRSLRRAVDLASGWAPFGLRLPDITAWLGRCDLPAGFDVVLQPPRPLDAVGAPEAATDALRSMEAAGATHASLRFVHHSRDHYIEQLTAVRELRW